MPKEGFAFALNACRLRQRAVLHVYVSKQKCFVLSFSKNLAWRRENRAQRGHKHHVSVCFCLIAAKDVLWPHDGAM